MIQTLGGIGLFLFGMTVMTSGLRNAAGSRLREWLATSTRTPLSGVVIGATMTALIQSSSSRYPTLASPNDYHDARIAHYTGSKS